MSYDVIIIGGSFSGLTSAYFLAKKGLKVCLFEKGKIGEFTKSTGILTKSVIDDLGVPDNLIETYINGILAYSPKMVEYEYRFKPLYFQSHTLKFLNWLKKISADSGVDIFEKRLCKDIKIKANEVICENKKANMLIVASCFIPRQIKSILPKENITYYSGLEYIAEGIKPKDKHMWEAYIDYDISPGYFSWITSAGTNLSHIGLLKKNNNMPIRKSMSSFLKKKKKRNIKIKEIRAGVVPLSRPIKKTFGRRFVIVGDAANHIGSFTSGGIHYAVRSAKILSRIIPQHIDEPTEENLKDYQNEWKKQFGKLLKEELWGRKIYDKFNSNERLELLLQIVDTIPRNKISNIFNNYTNLNQIHPFQTYLPHIIKNPMKILKYFNQFKSHWA